MNNTPKGAAPKVRATACGAAMLAVGLVITPTSLADSVLNEVDNLGNALQVSASGDIVEPQFALWPFTKNRDNVSDISYGYEPGQTDANEAVGLGSADVPWLFGSGSGNVAQFSSGGNVVNPQVAVFGDNTSKITVFGNWAENNGQGQSVTGGEVLGHVVDANGNIFQLEFFQGNVVNPQFAFMGDNASDIHTVGNVAKNNGGDTDGALAFVDANGNVVQVMILSHNVINPQVSVGGSNTVDVYTGGNLASGNGGDVTGIPGVFSIVKVGNVTQVAILSNNVWAPQAVLPDWRGKGGTNTSQIITETNTAEAEDIDVDLPGGTGGGPVDVGNINQWAPVGNGNISNPQWNLASKNTTPDVVNTPAPAPAVVTPAAAPAPAPKTGAPEEILLIEDEGTGGTKPRSGNWKPGDGLRKISSGLRKVSDDVRNAFTPKNDDSNDESSDDDKPADDKPSDGPSE